MTSFMDPGFLVHEGEAGFARQVQRLLALVAFVDIINIDGSGDRGGDIIARRHGHDWVFQAKWKKSANVDVSAVHEVERAMAAYGINRGVVVTNSRFAKSAHDRVAALERLGVNVSLWDGSRLSILYSRAEERPSGFDLHQYQSRAVRAAWDALNSEGQALVYLATGLGKTVVAGRILSRFLALNPGAQVLVTAHMRDLVEQLESAMWRDIPKHVPTRLLSGVSRPDHLPGVTFGVAPSARTYVESGYRPQLVIVDEAHHVGDTGNYADILDSLPRSKKLGVTATPWRGDRYNIEQTFGPPVIRVSISDGMRFGYLAKVRYRVFTDNIDWDFVAAASEKGYSMKDLNKRLFVPQRDEAIRDHLREVWHRTVRPRAIIFCQTIQHAEHMVEVLRQVPGWGGASTLHAGLGSRERRDRLIRFRSGEIPILTSVDILNEGVDVPEINILCFARVTHSRRIFVQQLGRGLRLQEGKDFVEVLDFVSDVRRMAEVYELKEQVSESEIEEVDVDRNQFVFTDQKITSLLDKWIEDVGDLADVSDSTRLDFPPMES